MSRTAHGRVADAAKVRVTNELLKDRAGDAIPRKAPTPSFPSQTEVDNIALRREIARLRQELRERSALQEQSASQLQARVVEFERERAVLEAAIERSDNQERTSIRSKLTRLLQVLTNTSAAEA
jgi:hypothetical protein